MGELTLTTREKLTPTVTLDIYTKLFLDDLERLYRAMLTER